MDSLIIISRLMDYPDQALWQSCEEICQLLAQCNELTVAQQQQLIDFTQQYLAADLLDKQAQYVARFDYNQQTSLHLFAHALGDSRDRGQAMVDLMTEYQQAGYNTLSSELPDYLPMLLEYLSSLGPSEASAWLVKINPILCQLHLRLAHTEFAPLFYNLIQLSGISEADIKAAMNSLNPAQQAETEVDILLQRESKDRLWRDEEVRFDSAPSCNSIQRSNQGNANVQYVNISAPTMVQDRE